MARQTAEDALRQSLPYQEAIAELKRVNDSLVRVARATEDLQISVYSLYHQISKPWWKRMFGL